MNNNELSDEFDILPFDIIGLASHLLRGADDTPVDPAVTKGILELFRNAARQLESESDSESELPQLALDLPADPAVTKSILELFRNFDLQLEAESDAESELPQLVLDLPADVTAVDVADAVVALSGSNIRFNPETQSWLVFDSETGWKWDPLCHRVHGDRKSVV